MRSLLIVCLALVGFAAVAFAADPPADDYIVKAPAEFTATQAPVALSHTKHKAIECKGCHHEWDGKAPIGKCSAKGCHDSVDAADKTGDHSFYRAFHDAKSQHSCMGCHKAMKAEQKAAGPVVCTQCHPKKAS